MLFWKLPNMELSSSLDTSERHGRERVWWGAGKDSLLRVQAKLPLWSPWEVREEEELTVIVERTLD